MKSAIPIFKPIGKTPLEAITLFKKEHPLYKDKKISYAGRLDPMAQGLVLLLVGEENKKRKEYESLKKEYDFSVLFGIRTDSFDLLGMPTISNQEISISKKQLASYVTAHTASFFQIFPPFSSKTINGIPLYRLARENTLDMSTLPSKQVTVYSFIFKNTWEIPAETLLAQIRERVDSVTGNFRQEQILEEWERLLNRTKKTFQVADFSISCSSGTYVRSIAQDMGIVCNTGALAFGIKRTSIGDFNLTQITP